MSEEQAQVTLSLEQQIEMLIDVATFQSGYWAGRREALTQVRKMLAQEEPTEEKPTED